MLVVILWIGSLYLSAALPQAARLSASRMQVAAGYYYATSAAVFPLLFLLLWPRYAPTNAPNAWLCFARHGFLSRLISAVALCLMLYGLGVLLKSATR
jgi:hypothetical protein